MNVAPEPPDGWFRPGITRREFDAACVRLELLYPGMSLTSGVRSANRNRMVGGSPTSKHLEGMARDYVFEVEPDAEDIALLYVVCKTLGFKAQYHDATSGNHLHVQSP